jgi:peptidoglycan/LPS O-acetylase OafA/YrhL
MIIERQPFRTLDGIRGIAALIVMTRHLPDMYGQFTFPRCYLAVDMFFVLSGFVIANAYAQRLKDGMGWREFMRIRFIRFYPFYALALLFGIIVVALEIALGGGRPWTMTRFGLAIFAGALMMPAPLSPGGILFPLNTPGWSLGFELAVNALYGAIHRWLSKTVLMFITCASALVFLRYAMFYGGANFGDAWDTILAGTGRVCYSFFAGVLVWHYRGSRRVSTLGSASIAAIVGIILMLQIDAFPLDIIAVLFGFPAIVWLAARVEPGETIAPIFIKLGLASYGLYVIHTPIGLIIERLAKANGYVIPIPYVGVIFMVAVTALVLWLDRYFDQPLRRYLLRVTGARKIT